MNIEKTVLGYANGRADGVFPKEERIKIAAQKFAEFLEALGCEWWNDPNSKDTPKRVAKAYVNELWKGRYENLGDITSFPANGYDGLVQESNIPIISMCSHHHQQIKGTVSVAYVPAKDGRVIGLSKINRIVEHFSRRGQIQESLTVDIHNAIDQVCEKNQGVAVAIDATHACVSCRGVKHQGTSMQTAKLSGVFFDNDSTKKEFYDNIKLSK